MIFDISFGNQTLHMIMGSWSVSLSMNCFISLVVTEKIPIMTWK